MIWALTPLPPSPIAMGEGERLVVIGVRASVDLQFVDQREVVEV